MNDPTVIGSLIAFGVLALLFGVIERWRPAIAGQKVLRPGYRTDLVYWLTTPFLTRSVTRIGVVLALIPLLALLGRPLTRESVLSGYGPLAQWSMPAQALAIVVVGGSEPPPVNRRAVHRPTTASAAPFPDSGSRTGRTAP